MKATGCPSPAADRRKRPPATPSRPELPPALINPIRLPGEEAVPRRVVLACTRPDLKLLGDLLPTPPEPGRRLWTCELRRGQWQGRELLLGGPLLGAPQAAMVLEKLIVLGAEAIVCLGWCGSLTAEVGLGALVLPDGAFGGDGTSPHYADHRHCHRPHPALHQGLASRLQGVADNHPALMAHIGPVWSTDAVFRETAALVARARACGAVALEMEMAALFAVGAFRGAAVAGLLVVTDELFRPVWRSGARSPQCRAARETAARLALDALAAWEEAHA